MANTSAAAANTINILFITTSFLMPDLKEEVFNHVQLTLQSCAQRLQVAVTSKTSPFAAGML